MAEGGKTYALHIEVKNFNRAAHMPQRTAFYIFKPSYFCTKKDCRKSPAIPTFAIDYIK